MEYVKNKARPKGSIAEANIHVECLIFTSIYLYNLPTRFMREERNINISVQTSKIVLLSVFS